MPNRHTFVALNRSCRVQAVPQEKGKEGWTGKKKVYLLTLVVDHGMRDQFFDRPHCDVRLLRRGNRYLAFYMKPR